MTTLCSTQGSRRRGARFGTLLSWVLLFLFPAATWAGGGVGGSGGTEPSADPSTNASSPGEEVTSLPVVDGTAGLTLVGSLREMRAVVRSVNGVGFVSITRVAPRVHAVTFVGDYRIVLDRPALVTSDLAILFRGGAPFQGGYALLQVGSSVPVLVPSERVPLPVIRLAASPRAQGALVTLDAFGLRAQRSHIVADFARGEVTLFQRSTL